MEATILLVEDDSDDLELMRRALTRAKVTNRIDVARDGQAALEFLFGVGPDGNRRHALPALVLLDIKLPKVDGLQVLQQLRATEETRLLPVVMLTSSDEQEDILKSYRLGVNSYVRKPVDFAKFSETVGQLGLYWMLVNRAALPAA
jgi:CheY-like chemotaxis protein